MDESKSSHGPNAGILAAASLALVVASIVVSAAAAGRVPVSPYEGATEVAAYYSDNAAAVRVVSLLQFGAAVPFGILAATAYARQVRLGVRVPGPAIGFFGGAAAAVLLMVSALLGWALAQPAANGDPAVVQALAFLAFGLGGVGYVTGSGLLVAGIAVPGLALRMLPRWLAWLGLGVAAVSELSFLSLAVDPLQLLLPVGRFGGLVWLVVAGALLMRVPLSGRANRSEQANQSGETPEQGER